MYVFVFIRNYITLVLHSDTIKEPFFASTKNHSVTLLLFYNLMNLFSFFVNRKKTERLKVFYGTKRSF